MSQTNSDALDVIAQVVVDTIDKKLDDANFDKSQVGTVVAVNGNDYTIAVFGSQYTITSDQVFTVGQNVVVTALQGDMKRLVCSPDNIGTMKTVDSKVNVIGDKVDNFIGNDFADTIIKFNDVKDQIDGSYIIWFESAEPTMSNSPAKDWTTADAKKVHVGDLYYNKVGETAYKWVESGGSYSWSEITNKDILKVLNAASRDNDTVDGKRRVFYGTPTTPYDQGDVWARVTSDGFMLICQTGRMIEDSYQRTDWVVASKYTDDFVADRAEEKADKVNTDLSSFKTKYDSDLKVTKEAIEARVTETKYQQGINGISTRLSTAESSIKQNATNITSKVSATDYTGKKIASMINQQADNVSISASKINLKGAVTTDSIATAGLDASVIKAGKISAIHLDLTGNITIGSGTKKVEISDSGVDITYGNNFVKMSSDGVTIKNSGGAGCAITGEGIIFKGIRNKQELYENNSDSFTSQTVRLDGLGNYSAILILFRSQKNGIWFSGGGNAGLVSLIVPVNGVEMSMVYPWNTVHKRSVTAYSDRIEFGVGYERTSKYATGVAGVATFFGLEDPSSDGWNQSNGMCVPYKIYGFM